MSVMDGEPYKEDDEAAVTFHADNFQVSVSDRDGSGYAAARQGWRGAYALGPLLGDGVSAKVYEAEAITFRDNDLNCRLDTGLFFGSCSGAASSQGSRRRDRRVAIKRFRRAGSRNFACELKALRSLRVHPHVLRLLESYEGYDEEDVLVLEYCDGLTLYDLYAQEHPHGITERLVARLVRQLLLALEHICACGVDHQDVKPENMMLHGVSVPDARGELKLGDFGWAEVAPLPLPQRPSSPVPRGAPAAAAILRAPKKKPATGVGSLWYAPPELNPPVEGISLPDPAEHGIDARGRSDMWSVGVVLYLLLVGMNPFNAARERRHGAAVDAEVLRLAALGRYDTRPERWRRLDNEARDLIHRLLQVKPHHRPSAAEALVHPFLSRRAGSVEMPAWPPSVMADRERRWHRLDGLQRLGWLSVARAVAEPELDRTTVAEVLAASQRTGARGRQQPEEASYLWQLARELALVPVGQWLRASGAWAEVVRLAFCYLDSDGDSILSPQDLASHVAGPSAAAATDGAGLVMACSWVARWQAPGTPEVRTARGHTGLTFAGFREALLASHGYEDDDLLEAAFDGRGGCSSPRRRGGPGGEAGAADRWVFGHDEEELSLQDLRATRGNPGWTVRAAPAAPRTGGGGGVRHRSPPPKALSETLVRL